MPTGLSGSESDGEENEARQEKYKRTIKEKRLALL